MDIPKYIGLFLLKNRFCYIHGLGNLELKKKPATFDGSVLRSSPYEVHITPAGSIDDNLANFIATNEQTSISKAANNLREFSTNSKAELAAGKEVIIPFVGKFVEINDKITFITDPDLQYTPPGIPAIKHARREDNIIKPLPPKTAKQKQSVPEVKIPVSAKVPDSIEEEILYDEPDANTGTGKWIRIVIIAVIAVVLTCGILFGIRLLTKHHKVAKQYGSQNTDTVLTPLPLSKSITQTSVSDVSAQDAAVYNMVIGTYHQLKDAQKREKQLKSYGHDVRVVTKDSSSYFVVVPITCNPADTTHVKDSLKIFEPRGVSIFR